MTARRLHVVSHTHWDREWYQSASAFQQRLVPLVDALLERSAAAAPFLLDGQAVLIKDYLAVRPERETMLRKQLVAGTLEAGPWYVLADNLIPCGEAIVRNLQAGRRVLARLGVAAPSVAYCPDTFGHPAALPTIAQGFGLDVAILWRGLGGRGHPQTDTLWWRGADDARLLVQHLPPDGYEFGSGLPLDAESARLRWESMRNVLIPRNRSGVMLLLNGADHHAAQPALTQRIAVLATAAAGDKVEVVASSLATFVREAAVAADRLLLPEVRGELRDSYGYTWTLQGTRATRAAQKRRNAQLERALLCDVEPWLVLAWLHQSSLPTEESDGRVSVSHLPVLLAHAWETLLQTHPHDTLCGCSIDTVARAMHGHQDAVHAQVQGLRAAALQRALAHDPAAAREQGRADGDRIVLRNRTAHARSGLAELRIVERVGDVRVGPGSASFTSPQASLVETTDSLPFSMTQTLSTRLAHQRLESPQHYPDDDLVRLQRVLAWIPEASAVPAFGVSVVAGRNGFLDRREPLPESPRPVTAHESENAIVIDNGRVTLTVQSSGITLAAAGRVWHNALALDSTTDAGDSYTPSLRGPAQPLTLTKIRLIDAGPLRARVRMWWEVRQDMPDTVQTDIDDMTVSHQRRGVRRASIRVCTTLVLDADSSHVRCDVSGVNRKRDHTLRLRWRTDAPADTVWADAAFGPVCRSSTLTEAAGDVAPTEREPEHGRLVEAAPATMPLHRWVSASGKHLGAALLSDGLADVAVEHGAFVVTLLRAIGELSRSNLPERPGHAGWPAAIPEAQSFGLFRARFALLPTGAWHAGTLQQIEDACDALLLPLVGETWRDYIGAVASVAGPSLEGVGLRASTVTISADGTAAVLRVVNIGDQATSGAWTMPDDGPWLVTPCRLDEMPTGPTERADARIAFTAPPRAVLTWLVRPAAR